MALFLLLIQLQSSIEITTIQKNYKEKKHYSVDSLKSFNREFSKHDFDDLRSLIIFQKKKFKTKSFQLWKAFENAILWEKETLFLKTLKDFKKNYHLSDRYFLLSYYKFFFRLIFRKEEFTDQEIFSFCEKYKDKPYFLSSILHEYLYQLSSKQEFTQNYLKAVLLKLEYDSNLSPSFLNKAFKYLYKYFRVKGSYDFLRIFLNYAIYDKRYFGKDGKKERTRFIFDYMELNYEQKLKELNEPLFLELKDSDLEEHQKLYVNLFYKKIFEVNFNKIRNKRVQDYVFFLQEMEKLNLTLTSGNVKQFRPSNLLVGKYNTIYQRSLIPIFALQNRESIVDSLYQLYRKDFITETEKKSKQLLSTEKFFSSETVINYILSKSDYVIALNELYQFHKILKETTLNKKSDKERSQLRRVLANLDTNLNLTSFSNFAELVYFDNSQKDLSENLYDNNNGYGRLVNSLDENEILAIYLKGSSKTMVFAIDNKNNVKKFLASDIEKLMLKLGEYDKIIVCDNQNLIMERFSLNFLKINKRIPRVYFVDNILLDKESEVLNTSHASFYGLDEPFHYEKEFYPSLHYLKEEPKILEDYFLVNNYYNSDENNFELNADFIQLSGHFLLSETHPIFNKIAIAYKDSIVQALAPYDFAFKRKVNTKVVFLNACQSANSVSYDDFSGQQQYSQYLLNAGVKSVIVAKKDIDDKTAVIFLEQFLKKLDNGFYLSEAIQRSKTYIKDNINSDPKFWDVYELYGEDFKVQFASNNLYYYIVIFTLLFIFSLFYKKVVTK